MFLQQATERWSQEQAAASWHGVLLGGPSAFGCNGLRCLYYSGFEWRTLLAYAHIEKSTKLLRAGAERLRIWVHQT